MPAYIRPLFCEGKGPFRWVALSGDPEDIYVTDQVMLDLFPEDDHLRRWMTMAQEQHRISGFARAHLLAGVRRTRQGLALQLRRWRTAGESAHRHRPRPPGLGLVASPNRETEGMRDGSDAIADWPILNALINAVGGATWVSFHHGGGVGIGYSLHAGQVIVADGTPEAARRLQRVLTTDPGMGVVRHVDAGYPEAIEFAKQAGSRSRCYREDHMNLQQAYDELTQRSRAVEHRQHPRVGELGSAGEHAPEGRCAPRRCFRTWRRRCTANPPILGSAKLLAAAEQGQCLPAQAANLREWRRCLRPGDQAAGGSRCGAAWS